jgi:hypothetical protein
MANSVVASWTACIKALQQLTDRAGNANVADAAVVAVRQHMNKLTLQPPLPNAVWKKLAQDVQVTYVLASLWVNA